MLSSSANTRMITLIDLLPYAFALHNAEEVLSMERWSHSVPMSVHPPVTTRQFALAVVLFTMLGFVLVYVPVSNHTHHILVAGFAGMLWLNVLFPHLIATLYFRKYAPGVVTALLINLPLTSQILWQLYDSGALPQTQLLIVIIMGGILGAGLAFLFLKIGNWLTTRKKGITHKGF